MPSVHIVGGSQSVETMFLQRGWTLEKNYLDADLIQFTGGEDVDPILYNEERHATTRSNPERDAFENSIYHQILDKPKAGICRGGQFLNIKAGGKLWQNVDMHTGGHFHYATDIEDNRFLVNSLHHQMMKPSKAGIIFLTARLSRIKETATHRIDSQNDDVDDVEGVYYPHVKSFCYQPHPELVSNYHACREFYFEGIERWLELKV